MSTYEYRITDVKVLYLFILQFYVYFTVKHSIPFFLLAIRVMALGVQAVTLLSSSAWVIFLGTNMEDFKGLTDNELIARLKKYSIPHGPVVGMDYGIAFGIVQGTPAFDIDKEESSTPGVWGEMPSTHKA